MDDLIKKRKLAKSKAKRALVKLGGSAENYSKAMDELRKIENEIDDTNEKIADSAVREALGINDE